MSAAPHVINDVTHLNPVPVWAVATPTSIAEIQDAIARTTGPISIGGGRFSMGGQTASPGSLHLDMRRMNRVLAFSPETKTIRVQAGIRWCDIQKFIDPHGFSVKIMQTYANFTVGGSLSVNVHGRYVGLGPLILSIRSITLALMNGEILHASPSENSELFFGAIGGYGGLGIIVEAELELDENKRVERIAAKLAVGDYHAHFRKTVRDNKAAVFHNGDLYVPHFKSVRSVTWVETLRPATAPHRLQPHRQIFALEKYFLWAISETPFGKWRREYIIDPLLYLKRVVHWRNYEAGYNVAELEPPSRKHRTYVLQEYFVPVERFEEFVPKMAEIFNRHRVNVLNVSIRHAMPDPGSLLAWARSETFAFVVYYKQRTRANARDRVAVWTRELIDAAISVGGAYYLPYQAHATHEQFHQAYPRAREYFQLKARLDPEFRLRNVLWDKYYAPTLQSSEKTPMPAEAINNSDFHTVYGQDKSADAFYKFLQNVYHLYPEDRFHTLIKEACAQHQNDEAIYRQIQAKLPGIKPFLADLFYALPALAKQKKEMTRQTLELLGDKREINGYTEIGTTGRYYSDLRKQIRFTGRLVLINEVPPSNSPPDIVERGQLAKFGDYVAFNDHAAIAESDVASNSMEMVSCYIGLHHSPLDKLDAFIASIHRILKPGGIFILRDHDVTTPQMHAFVALAHAVFNAGLGVPWETNHRELRHFRSIADWVSRLEAAGFRDSGKRLLQAHDPSDNVLMAFTKV